ncbi:hypothetical protein Pflav_085980 [Phytohabitans flavus]|uniref:Signal recognition particle SRP54 helical bundle domain-containing protein n=1 Tax=Phytohabitans flavus TaxID=1076124 RepID=A0A6F8Y876_9ACTN|nr:hypothetical protein Pflav_085980 [Phytohabitans flavus]
MEYVVIALVLLGVLVLGGLGLVIPRLRRRPELPPPPAPPSSVETAPAPVVVEEPPVEATPEAVTTVPEVEVPEPTAGRLIRLRARLSRSQSVLGKGLLGLLSRDRLDEDVWDEVEENLITADVGVEATVQIVERLRERTRVLGTRTPTSCAGC